MFFFWRKTRLLLVLVMLLFSQNGRAATVRGIYRYRVTGNSCVLQMKSKKGWRRSKTKLPRGTVVIGRPYSKNPEVIVFKLSASDSRVWAGKKSCLFHKPNQGKATLEQPIFSGAQGRFHVSLGVANWQEVISIASSSVKTKLRATNISGYLGAGWMQISDQTEYGFHSQFLYAKAQVANAAPPSGTDLQYGVTNVDVMGMVVSPVYFYRPISGAVAFGASIPVFVRYALYPQVNADRYTIGPRFRLLSGFVIESRFERESLLLGQRVGFLNSPKSLYWNLEIGWRF